MAKNIFVADAAAAAAAGSETAAATHNTHSNNNNTNNNWQPSHLFSWMDPTKYFENNNNNNNEAAMNPNPQPPPKLTKQQQQQQNSILRNMISVLSFESAFRRDRSAAADAKLENTTTATTADKTSTELVTPAEQDAAALDRPSSSTLESLSRQRSLVPPSSRSLSRNAAPHPPNSNELDAAANDLPPPHQLLRKYSSRVHVNATNILHGTLDPDGGAEFIFFDCVEFIPDDDDNDDEANKNNNNKNNNNNTLRCVDFRRDSVVMSSIRLRDGEQHDESVEVRSKNMSMISYPIPMTPPKKVASPTRTPLTTTNTSSPSSWSSRVLGALTASLSPTKTNSYDENESEDLYPLPPPPPPQELPLRFLRAGKGDPEEGLLRYQATLQWRKEYQMDTILREPNEHFDIIKTHYPHFFAGQGRMGEPCFYEQPPKTNLKALRENGVTIELLLRHYMMVTEFQWQYLERDDLQRSVYIIDCQGLRMGDFVGEVVDFVKQASSLSAQHYPERAGYVFIINVPMWFKMIFSVIKPLIDESTLEKIYILRGAEEIRTNMLQRIAMEHIPADYGGEGPKLGESIEEKEFRALVEYNNAIAQGNPNPVIASSEFGGPDRFRTWQQPRSY